MKPRLPLICCLLAAFSLAGCLRGTPPPSYYSLMPLAEPAMAATEPKQIRLGVVLGDFPEALERIQILTRNGYRVDFSEQHRWAAPLRQEVERVLVGNLGRALGPEQVAPAPWPGYFNPTNRLVVDVQQLDGALCGAVELRARWVVTDAAGRVVQLQQSPTLSEVADCGGYADYVAAQSRLLARLSGEIMAALENRALP